MLQVRLFGQFDIQLNDAPIEVPSRSAQSLLAYLLLNAGTAHRRVKLAGLFWPDTSESNARNNLRHALWRIRKAIGHDHLLTDNVSVTLDTASDYWLDAAVLETAVDEDGSADELIDIVAVYTGELLPGFYDDWVVLERERLRAVFEQQSKRLLDRLVEKRSLEECPPLGRTLGGAGTDARDGLPRAFGGPRGTGKPGQRCRRVSALCRQPAPGP